ncbi:MAG TPA: hypothetical protein VEG39_13070 [Clostridia bacterium]|nr:hypothetical protein [Clostridia bacterium]
MNIEIATHDIIPEWLGLAREVEPLFQASMADDPEFKAFMESKIAKNVLFQSRVQSLKSKI